MFHFKLNKTIRSLALLGSLALVSGCAGYSQNMASTMDAVKAGSIDGALSNLEASNTGTEKDLLFYLEKGELLRMKGDYAQSRDTWLQADEKIRLWEDAVKADSSKVLGDIGSVLISDTTRRYDGRDYEKVFVSVRIALDHLALGDFDAARIEVKKMHEREAIIAEFRAKELESVKKESEKKGLKATSFKELDGYPVETLDDPQVKALKNSYESAFANYLAGFVYEALGEPSLAAAGYRKAIEMRPGEATLEEGLKGLDGRVSQMRQNKPGVDTLFVVETGYAPTIISQTIPIPLPIPTERGLTMVLTALSWPVLQPVDSSVVPSNLILDGKPQPLVLITNADQMARRALADEMPSIIIRSSVRAIAKGVVQKQVQDKAASLGLAGALVGAAASVAAVGTEKADERTWRTLPAFYSVGRAMLPPGTHALSLAGRPAKEINVSGKHSVIVIRMAGNGLYLAQNPAQNLPEPEIMAPKVVEQPIKQPETINKPTKVKPKLKEVKKI